MAHKASLLEDWLKEHKIDTGVFYTYWMNDWATILSVLRSKKIINHLTSRAHRFDLYEYRQENNFIPFRPYQLKHIDKVFLISNEGLQYLKLKYPGYEDKMRLSYLGTTDHGINYVQSDHKIHLVSISNFVPVKRVHRIVDILENVKKDILWTHFGDGVLMDEIVEQSKKLPKNIDFDFKGRVANRDVLHFLKNKPVSFFINVSESEGLPVSIMEAISFGIPVIATDVGGVSEIVNKNTGILLEKEFNIEIVSGYLDNYSSSQFATIEFRKKVRRFWELNFNAKNNYAAFCKEIK
jgi:glycosyltransferase involved in cell wall biosynthesis